MTPKNADRKAHPSHRSLHSSVGGFTLIELLVVISIITLLVALLLPVIGKARATAQQVTCSAQQRQLAQAFTVYLPDYKEVYPYGNPAGTYNSWSAATNRPWMMAINSYLGGYNATDPASYPSHSVVIIFRCPSNWRIPFASNSQFQPATTYGYNNTTGKLNANAANPTVGAFPANWHDSSGNNPAVQNPADPTNAPAFTRPTRENQLTNPSRMLFMGEIMNGREGASGYMGAGMTSQALQTGNFNGAAMWLDSLEEAATTGTGANSVRVQHNFGWNSLFADSHVEYTSKERLNALSGSTGNPLNTPDRSNFWRGRPTPF